MAESLESMKYQYCIARAAVEKHKSEQLVRQPEHGERRRNRDAHPGDFAS